MPQTLRFHLDEHVPGAIAAGLRRRGIDVTTAADAGLLGAEDDAHLAYALAQGRVIYTNDEDYLVLHDYCHQQSRSIGDVIRALALFWKCLSPRTCEITSS